MNPRHADNWLERAMDSAKLKLPVYLRLKPKHTDAATQFLEQVAGEKRVVTDPPKESRYKAKETFSFSGIFNDAACQQDVYKGLVYPLVENFLLGRDSLLFTMGASGSGKTHTLLGYKDTPGMIHFSIDTIFKSLKSKLADFEEVETVCDGVRPTRTSAAMEAGLVVDWTKPSKAHVSSRLMLDQHVELDANYKYAVYFTMVEIYNDRIFDLFGGNGPGTSTGAHRKALTLKTDAETGRVGLTEARKLFVCDKDEAYRIVEHGLSTRAAHSTGANTASSRSHAFLIIEMKRIPRQGSEFVKTSTLTIVDLAGSERVKTAKTTGNRLVESGAINKSLMLLGQCLQMQRSKEASKIDSTTFRNSKLTQLLLANAFNEKLGQKSAILVNIDPYGDFNAASQILRYSALARDVAVPQTRVTSLSKIKQAEATTTSAAMSSQQISRHPTQNAQDQDKEAMASELATAYERIQELESLVADAENEINEVETRVRMEMADEMDRRLTEMQQSFRQRLDEDWERNQDVADRKIAIFSELNTTADPSDLLLEVERLQRENQMLRHENDHLSNIIHHAEMSSPRKRSRVNA